MWVSSEWWKGRKWEREMFLYNSLVLFLDRENLSSAFSSSVSARGWTMTSQDKKLFRRRSSLSSRLLSLESSRSWSYSRILKCLEAARQVYTIRSRIYCIVCALWWRNRTIFTVDKYSTPIFGVTGSRINMTHLNCKRNWCNIYLTDGLNS